MKCRNCSSPYGEAKLVDESLSAVWVGAAALKLGWQKVVKSDNKLVLRKGM